jgi:hypothetical protein
MHVEREERNGKLFEEIQLIREQLKNLFFTN